MDLELARVLQQEYETHYLLAQSNRNPDGNYDKKGISELVQATIRQFKLSQCFTGSESEAHLARAQEIMHIIREALTSAAPLAKLPDEAVEQPVGSGKPRADDAKGQEGDDWLLESAPSTTFDDIVGLENVKREILETLSWPLEHRHLMDQIKLEMNNRYLLFGPPGTGKTMIAKAIANYIMKADARFYSVQCSNLVSKYVGESEKNIKELFERAAKAERAVIFMDEFDALCPARSEGENQVNNRIVAELLARTDGVTGAAKGTILIMATNFPWRIDSAMLSRTGNRFYIPLPDEQSRLFALKRKLGHLFSVEDVRLEDLARNTEGYSHRDLNSLCEAAQRALIRRCIQAGDQLLPLSEEDVRYARETVRSSANIRELREMEKWVKDMN